MKYETAICESFPIPPHVSYAARALKYDLLHGPTWSLIPRGDIKNFTFDHFSTDYSLLEKSDDSDIIEETYVGMVGDCLREFIETLPTEIWFDCCADYLMESEPESYFDEIAQEWIEPFWDEIMRLTRRDIIAALFGEFMAREFN